MTLIEIRERRQIADDEFSAEVVFDHGAPYRITVKNPFTEEQEKRLEWYFEQHLRFPFTDQVKAQQAGESVSDYGTKLFEQVFRADVNAYAKYSVARQAGVEQIELEIAGSPEFHRLHWEAIRDSDLKDPLALSVPIVRKNLKTQPVAANVRESPTINLLLVTARPDTQADVGYRTISRPLVEGLDRTDVPVQIDILRPGTFQALSDHLQ